RRCEAATTSMFEGADVVDAAIAVTVEGHCGRDGFSFQTREKNVVRGAVCGGEEVLWHAGDAKVLVPVGQSEVDVRPRETNVVERHGHRPRRRVERVAAAYELVAQGQVAFVDPGCEARHPGSGVDGLHCVECA